MHMNLYNQPWCGVQQKRNRRRQQGQKSQDIFLWLQHDCNEDRNSSSAPCLPNKWEAKSQMRVQKQNTARHRSPFYHPSPLSPPTTAPISPWNLTLKMKFQRIKQDCICQGDSHPRNPNGVRRGYSLPHGLGALIHGARVDCKIPFTCTLGTYCWGEIAWTPPAIHCTEDDWNWLYWLDPLYTHPSLLKKKPKQNNKKHFVQRNDNQLQKHVRRKKSLTSWTPYQPIKAKKTGFCQERNNKNTVKRPLVVECWALLSIWVHLGTVILTLHVTFAAHLFSHFSSALILFCLLTRYCLFIYSHVLVAWLHLFT